MNNLLKNIGIWLVIGLVVLTVVKQFDSRQSAKDSVAYSDFMESARSGRVESAVVEGRSIKWVSTDKKRYHLQMRVGHYGVFNGSRFRKEIAPAIAEFILEQELAAALDRRAPPRLRKVVG